MALLPSVSIQGPSAACQAPYGVVFFLDVPAAYVSPALPFPELSNAYPYLFWVVFFLGGGGGGQAEQFILFHRITASSHLSDALWEQAPLLPHPSLYLTSATLPQGLL